MRSASRGTPRWRAPLRFLWDSGRERPPKKSSLRSMLPNGHDVREGAALHAARFVTLVLGTLGMRRASCSRVAGTTLGQIGIQIRARCITDAHPPRDRIDLDIPSEANE